MKLLAGILIICCVFTGCSPKEQDLDAVMELRQKILHANSCRFDATISAFYDESVYIYDLTCESDQDGNLQFTVISPESIAGITGTLSANEAALTFDDTILTFPQMADGRVSPVTGVWIFLNTLRSGYLSACGRNADGLILSIDDSYESDPLHLEIQTDHQAIPIGAEIYYNQQRVLLIQIRNFTTQ